MVYKTQRGGRQQLKVTYTNVNGLITVREELNEYLKRIKPDIVGLTEIKLDKSKEWLEIGDGKYNIWKKVRLNKQGGGVMILVKKRFKSG